jgi:hypothetical protein
MKATEQRFACKLVCDWLPLGKRQKQAKLHERVNCPRCGHVIEDLDHFLRCTKATEWRTEFLDNLQTHLEELDTAKSIREELLGGVSSWFTESEHDPGPQTDIGWRAFLQGYLASQWNHRQDDYLIRNKTRSLQCEGGGDRKDEGHRTAIRLQVSV